MSIAGTSVWEVRPTVGSDTNGGGFVPGSGGTDYSQQNSANSSGSNQSTTDAVTIGTTTLTSATASFTSVIVGNIIYLSGSGVTTGWYQVVTFTNSTTVVLDRSPGTGTGGTMNIGGALATISQAYANATLSNMIWIMASGAYTVTAPLTLTGANPTPFLFVGYTSVRGDGGQVTWTTATNSTTLIQPGTGGPANFVFQNFVFSTTASAKIAAVNAGSATSQGFGFRFINCKWASAFPTAVLGGYDTGVNFNMTFLTFEDCEITNCSGVGVTCSGGTKFVGCRIHGNGGGGVLITAALSGTLFQLATVTFIRSVVDANTGIGISAGSTSSFQAGNPLELILINSAVVNNSSDNITLAGTNTYMSLVVENTVNEMAGGFGINNTCTGTCTLRFESYNNAYFSNTSGNFNGVGLASGPGDVTLTGDPFTNSSAGDFTLNSTGGAGAACKAVGFPSSLP